MKSAIKYSIIVFLISIQSFCQNYYLIIEGQTLSQTNTIDSISYLKKHKEIKSILEETTNFNSLLTKKGYLEHQILESKKNNDSTFYFKYELGKQIKKIKINTTENSEEIKNILQLKKEETLNFYDSELFLNTKLSLLEKYGYAQSKIKLINFKKSNDTIFADLNIETKNSRKINQLVFLGYEHFPNGIKKNIFKKHQLKPFNKDIVKKINTDINTLPFVKQIKYPEVLLTTDSTKVYIYLEKRKTNSFDGFIGFGNNDEAKKIQLNGYLDLNLYNNLNAGEKFNLYWKNDGNKQSTFNANIDLSYIFNSPIALKSNLKIFKQDTIFQSSSFGFDIGYMLTYQSKLFLGYKDILSEAIQKNTSTYLKDLKATFYTTTFEYKDIDFENLLFPEKFTFYSTFGFGKRLSENNTTKQFYTQICISKNLILNKNNHIFIKNENLYLHSNNYLSNELFRFGGIQSIRGFNENSLQGNIFSGIFIEYRNILSPNLYFHTITDFGYQQDKATNNENQLYGLGLGLGLLTKGGMFHLVYANGNTNKQTIKLNNSIVQISFKTNF